ncbi:MAG: hypothetical protein JWR52_2642 [Marmoricola sp.]|nr:hypothetical protein [Marmoricola sp.]
MDRRNRQVRSGSPVAGVVMAALTLAVAASGCAGNVSIRPPAAPPGTAQDTEVVVQADLDQFAAAVRGGDVSVAPSIEAPGSSLVRDVVENAAALGIRDFSVRDVDDHTSAPGAAIQDEYGSGAWVSTVQFSYRLPQDPGPTTMESDVVFVPGQDGSARIVGIGAPGARGALWLQGRVGVRKDAQILLIAAEGQSVARYWAFARRAVRDVTAVLGPRRAPLVFEVPSSQSELEQLINAPVGTYNLIAGVTASIDGSATDRTPVHSFFNTNLMTHEGRRGGQLVVSHEATLQATRAPVSPIPIWMEEGFADYVPLASAGLPLQVTAKEISAQVRTAGPPNHLPNQTDFDFTRSTFAQLNAVYESAWLACRYIAARWGQPKLLLAYDDLNRGWQQALVFRRVLGLSDTAFVAGWRHYLVQIATRTRS